MPWVKGPVIKTVQVSIVWLNLNYFLYYTIGLSYDLSDTQDGHNINVLQQTACYVVNPITVGNFASLFNCIPVGRTSDSMAVPTKRSTKHIFVLVHIWTKGEVGTVLPV